MNFMLKDATKGGSIEVRSGQYQFGDGSALSVAGNFGYLCDGGQQFCQR
jgi:iron complex outermembrane receptor protein